MKEAVLVMAKRTPVGKIGGQLSTLEASGAILMTRLYSEMLQNPYQRGLATLGIGGGMGLAVLVEAAI